MSDLQQSEIRWVHNDTPYRRQPTADLTPFAPERLREAHRFHTTIPGYEPTPLHQLPGLARYLGLRSVLVKDESYRFGLNAFKALGASYAIAQHLAARLGRPLTELPFRELTAPTTRQTLGEVTFATTTDGNHGRGVAWTARMLGQRAVVYMPQGSARFRLEAIRAEGAEAQIVPMNYDESVRLTAADAARHGWIVVQDTAWEGYQDIPRWIMQGYGTMMREVFLQLELAARHPTHVLIQAGVGSLAGMVQAALLTHFGPRAPRVLVVEPEGAPCFYESARIGDGRPHTVTGDLATLMAGLACGEPNPIGFHILRDHAAAFLRCPDYVAARAMRILAIPLKGDPRVISGESGAVTLGALSFIMRDPRLAEFRQAMGLDDQAEVLLFSTEGNTDPERFRSVVWEGEFPTWGLM